MNAYNAWLYLESSNLLYEDNTLKMQAPVKRSSQDNTVINHGFSLEYIFQGLSRDNEAT
jgi:hypothetical protein